jgi:hypothetical protein
MNPSDDEKKAVEDLPDEVKRKAIEAGFATKDVAEAQSLTGTPENTDEMRDGSPRSPGVDEHSGKTMKPDPGRTDPPPSQVGGGNVFEQALAVKLSEIAALDKSQETPEPGGGMDL